MTSIAADPTTVLDAYEEAPTPQRRRELATFLADLASTGESDLSPMIDRLRRMRGSETDLEARGVLRRLVNQLTERQAGIRHDEGLKPLADDARARIRRSLAELDTLYVSLEPAGRKLEEVYALVDSTVAATGGFGEIWKMQRREDQLLVAVKYLKGRWAAHEGARDRFERETATLRSIHERGGHPHLLPWVEDGTDGKRAFLVTSWADGGSLWDQVLAHPYGAPLGPALLWLRQALEALEAMHGWGLIHRDVKPPNLFLVEEGGPVWLGDFGVVLDLAGPRLTRVESGSPGTPEYAPPEQLLGLDQDERTDLFSWAATAFEVLAGQRAATHDFGTSPQMLRPGIPDGWDAAIRACRAEKRGDRPRDVAAVLAMLGED